MIELLAVRVFRDYRHWAVKYPITMTVGGFLIAELAQFIANAIVVWQLFYDGLITLRDGESITMTFFHNFFNELYFIPFRVGHFPVATTISIAAIFSVAQWFAFRSVSK